MLNIGRMAAGSQGYYLGHVAQTTLDYHLGRGEEPGRWLGTGLDAVGLASGEQITADQLGAILEARHPVDGDVLTSHPARKVPGFDLTFRPPKSVSLLWGLTDDATMGQVEAAHHAAIDVALRYLERNAGRSRRGAGGTESVKIDGFVAAGFTHRTSREGDPLLHTHVLIANLARATDDGKWRTLDSRRIYTHARAAGSVYQAVLRHELTVRLGVGWEPVKASTADIAGVPRGWIEAFSKRRLAIVAELDRRGLHSAAAAQAATLDTRRAKRHQPDTRTLQERWRAEARTVGMPDGWWHRLTHRATPDLPDVVALYGELVRGEGLTQDRSTFSFRDLVREVADRLPVGGSEEDLAWLVNVVYRAGRQSGELVPLGQASGDRAEPRLTTRRLLDLEQATVDRAVADRSRRLAVAEDVVVESAIERRPTLAPEQARMVEQLTRSGDGVAVVVGRAGTGKTFALDAAREAWERSGFTVTGAALAARAAAELEESAGIHATTIASLLRQLDDPAGHGPGWWPGRHVLVVDEAGMVGTRQLAHLLDHAHDRSVKVVLVGDPRQLPEIQAGGLFGSLARALPATTLTTNRRQTAAWEIDALDELRDGDPTSALRTYVRHGRVTTADSADALREQLVGDWWHNASITGAHDSVMIALHRSDVDDLNRRAHERADAAGWLHGPGRPLGDSEVKAGDRIVCLRNDRTLGVLNGTRGTVDTIWPDGSVRIWKDGGGGRVVLPPSYVDAGHLAHGYAITGHKAQGLTVDHAHVLGSEALYRQWGYVAMSRGRHSNHLYLHERAAECHQTHDRTTHRTQSEQLRAAAMRLGRSGAQVSLSAPPRPVVEPSVVERPEPVATRSFWPGARGR